MITIWDVNDPLVLIGIAIGIYFVGSRIHSAFSGNQEMGSSTTSYHCPQCHHRFNWMFEVKGRKAVECPACGTVVRVQKPAPTGATTPNYSGRPAAERAPSTHNFCSWCGAKSERSDRFCYQCGREKDESAKAKNRRAKRVKKAQAKSKPRYLNRD